MSLQHAILGLLSYQPMTGYDLKQVFDQSINFFWSAQLSQIYRDLGTLESKSYVTYHIEKQEGRPDRKVYSITEEGKKALQEWLLKFPQSLTPSIREDFSLRIFFGSKIPTEEIKFQLKRFIKEEEGKVDLWRSIEKMGEAYAREISRPEEKFFWDLTLKRGYIMAEASIHWAEECLKELADFEKTSGRVQ